jgi:hypothetical protein
VPLPADELLYDRVFLTDGAPGRSRSVLCACARDALESHLDVLDALGLSPTEVTAAPVAMANACRWLSDADRADRFVGINFQNDAMQMACLRAGELTALRAAPAGDSAPEEGLPLLARPLLLELTLSGGASTVCLAGRPRAVEAAGRELREVGGVESSQPRWDAVDTPALSDEESALLRERCLPLVGAAGAALGQGATASINLLPEGRQRRALGRLVRTPARIAAALLLALLLLWSGTTALARRRISSELAATRGELAAVWHSAHPNEALPPEPARVLRGELMGAPAGPGGLASVRLGALRALRDVTDALPPSADHTSYRSIGITPSRIEIEGSAPNYASADRLVRRLEGATGLVANSPELAGKGGRVTFRVELARDRGE